MANKFQQGIYEVRNPSKYVGKHRPKYRSGWELRFMRLLDEHPNILACLLYTSPSPRDS